jgi:PKD domain
MACTITITSVTGVPLANGAPGALSAITIAGTSSGLPDGTPIDLACQCFAGGGASATVMNNAWQVTRPAILLDPRQSACSCAENITIEVAAPNFCTSAPWNGPISCPACPQIQVTAQVGNCAGGVANVTLTVNVTQPAGSTAVLQWEFGDGNNGVPIVVNGTGSSSQTHPYAQGTYTATLLTILPSACPQETVEVTVPDCDCPQIQQITFSQGECNANGYRQVTATVVGGPAGTIYWQWDVDASATPGGNTSTRTLAGGTTHSVTVSIAAGGCQQQLSASVTVDACEAPPPCPSITALTATPSGGSAPLPVNFVATVANQGSASGANPYVWDFGDGNSASTPNPTASNTYKSAGNYSACVTVNGPANCGTSKPACTGVTVTSASTGGGGGGGSSFGCAFLLIAALILLFVGGIVLIVGVCIKNPYVIAAGAACAAVGLVLFVIWAIFCSALTSCGLMETVDCLLFWIVAILGPIASALMTYVGGLPCGATTALTFVGWGSIYAWLGQIMLAVHCARKKCW